MPTAVFVRRVLAVMGLTALAALLWFLRDVLLLLFGALILATILRTVALPIERRLKWSPRRAVLVVVLFTAVLSMAGSWLLGARLIEETGRLQERLPDALAAVTEWIEEQPGGPMVLEGLTDAQETDVPWASVASAARLTVGALGNIALIIIVGIYLAADPLLYRNGLLRLSPPAYRERFDAALQESGRALSKWLLGQGISMLFVGGATAAGLAVLGMPLALALGFIAGLLAFIPFFGPIFSGLLAILLAFVEGPTQALYVAGLCILIQQVEGNLLMPFVQRWASDLPPVLGIMAAVIFGVLFGVAGVIFATPLMVVVMVLVQRLYIAGLIDPQSST